MDWMTAVCLAFHSGVPFFSASRCFFSSSISSSRLPYSLVSP